METFTALFTPENLTYAGIAITAIFGNSVFQKAQRYYQIAERFYDFAEPHLGGVIRFARAVGQWFRK